MLAARQGEVMDKFISLNQFSFIKGRILVDSVAIVNEVIDLAKNSKKICFIFKESIWLCPLRVSRLYVVSF